MGLSLGGVFEDWAIGRPKVPFNFFPKSDHLWPRRKRICRLTKSVWLMLEHPEWQPKATEQEASMSPYNPPRDWANILRQMIADSLVWEKRPPKVGIWTTIRTPMDSNGIDGFITFTKGNGNIYVLTFDLTIGKKGDFKSDILIKWKAPWREPNWHLSPRSQERFAKYAEAIALYYTNGRCLRL